MSDPNAPIPLFARDLKGFGRLEPLCVSPETSLQEAAKQMEAGGWDAAIVVEAGALRGIITDRDFRKKALAEGLSPLEPVSRIMSGPIEALEVTATRSDGLLQMIAKKRHHLVIVDQGRLLALATKEDFIAERTYSPLFFAGRIQEAGSPEELQRIFNKLPSAMRGLLAEGLSVERVGPIISGINDWMMRRAGKLAKLQMPSPPPVPFAVMVLGSEGRGEQTFKTDQDNALIHAELDPEDTAAKEWFMEYARKLCRMLDQIGYPYCPGEIMAQNPRWNLSIGQWKDQFSLWVQRPAAEEILRANIFFDFRGVYGELSLVAQLEDHLFSILPKAGPFPANLAQAAVQAKPPLGLFGGFKTGEGDHAKALDIKEKGTALITDLARAFCLIDRLRPRNTLARLRALEAERKRPLFRELREALETLTDLRLRHQLTQIEAGKAPDNWIAPGDLTEIEQGTLKQVFKTIQQGQEALLSQYAGGVR
ncbi:MAG: DUF294 nucleotidyltransferase-like domain-containing protein [bacterium]|nr:DUF294 nucleotidyltransferase-like domain-containing protein [bacterium]